MITQKNETRTIIAQYNHKLMTLIILDIAKRIDIITEVNMIMLAEVALLVAIYAVWIVVMVNAMVSSEEISLTVATITFILTVPISLILAALLETIIAGIFQVNLLLMVIVSILFAVRWVMALVGE